jgi:hypothetical protein
MGHPAFVGHWRYPIRQGAWFVPLFLASFERQWLSRYLLRFASARADSDRNSALHSRNTRLPPNQLVGAAFSISQDK